ncbi:MAG TPA: DUF1573 domain-containing protein [Microscillaceae bacterium]|jgi:hypothetical protein|nr:DUF1573 domain-containing protein [Microscillaceae bacterium]
MKKLFFVWISIALCSITTAVKAQQQGFPTMYFENILHNFGEIAEETGVVTHSFRFKNTGDVVLQIDSVVPSCGCTTPSWTRGAIAPGQNGEILASYDPTNRPGDFTKYLTVYANTQQKIVQLVIQGKVNPRPRTILDTLVTKMGGIRVQYQAFNFGYIANNGPVTQTFDVYNDSTAAITFKDPFTPGHVQVQFEPQTLQPKQKGKIRITYDAQLKNDLGYVFDNIVLTTDEPQNPAKQMFVVAVIQEYFPPMSEAELAAAPKILVENPTHDFGTIKLGDKVNHLFTYKNIGQNTLLIRKTKASCGCTASNPDKTTLNTNEAGSVSVTFDALAVGQQEKTITIFSNDPKNASLTLTIKANVVQNQ